MAYFRGIFYRDDLKPLQDFCFKYLIKLKKLVSLISSNSVALQ